jgi:O-antigen/teichoic acid export membrane protein
MGIINQVAFSASSRTQDDATVARTGLSTAIRLLAYSTLPLLVGLACVAPEFIPLLLGEKWVGAVLPLQLMAIAVPFRILSALLSTAVSGLGRADVDFRNTLTGVVVMPLCFLAGLQWGAIGLAGSWLVGTPCVLLMNYGRTRSVVGLTMAQTLQLTARPALATLLMVLAIVALRIALADRFPSWGLLLAMLVGGGLTFGVAAWSLDSKLREMARATSIFGRINTRR